MQERKVITIYADVERIRYIEVKNPEKGKADYFFRRRGAEWINEDPPKCSSCGYTPLYDEDKDDYNYSAFCPDCGEAMENGIAIK